MKFLEITAVILFALFVIFLIMSKFLSAIICLCFGYTLAYIADQISKKKAKAMKAREAQIRQFEEQERKRKIEEEIQKEAERRRKQEAFEKAEREKKDRELRESFRGSVNLIPEFNIELSDQKHNRNKSINFECKCKNVTKATPINKIKNFVSVDVDTTGLKTSGNDIIHLTAVRYEDFFPVEKFDTYIKPRNPIPLTATSINGITDEMVENKPKFCQIAESFDKFIKDFPLVAHNAPFVMEHLFVNGLTSINNKIIYDTLTLSQNIMKNQSSYKLKDICNSIGVYMYQIHNSIYDSYATGELFMRLIAMRNEITLYELEEMV